MTTVVGTFDNKDSADRAVRRLVDDGVEPDSIGVLMRDHTRTEPETVDVVTYEDHHDDAGHEAGKGAIGGAIGGASAGAGTLLLASVGVALVPGIGALLAAGTVAATAAAAGAGAVGGAATGGLFGAVIGAGDHDATKVTEEQTRYREVIDRDGALVSIETDQQSASEAVRALETVGAGDVTTMFDTGGDVNELANDG